MYNWLNIKVAESGRRGGYSRLIKLVNVRDNNKDRSRRSGRGPEQLVQWLRRVALIISITSSRLRVPLNSAQAASTDRSFLIHNSQLRQLINWLNVIVFYILMFTQLSNDNVAQAIGMTATRAHIN